MPRAKVTARRRKPASLNLDVGLDDMLPTRLVEYLKKLPLNTVSDTPCQCLDFEERPSKRRKNNSASGCESIYVAQGEVTVSRRYSESSTVDLTETRHDVGSHLKFSLMNGRLRISSRTSPSLGSLSAVITLRPQDLSPQAETIIDVAGSNAKQSSPGSLWTTIDLTVQRSGRMASIKLEFKLYWNETPSPFHILRSNRDRVSSQRIIDDIFPAVADDVQANQNHAAWSPLDFYEAAFVPPKDDATSATIDIPGLDATLFPYQKRTVNWLLTREGVRWCEARQGLEPLPKENSNIVETFREVNDMHGNRFFLSDVFHTVTRHRDSFRHAQLDVKGGILAEEMGLGKSLETIGLILLHQRPSDLATITTESGEKLIPSGATLIVTPESLRAQWVSEIARHAPGLRVKYYKGCKKLSGDHGEGIVKELADYDVVITTYTVLSSELHFTTTPPDRPRRYERVYARAKSPLVQISWWRVCLDEAQMIENGFSQAAVVARVIPRVHAWGITGTPVKDDVKDLFGLLLFLRYEPFCSAPHIWQALLGNYKHLFQQLFNSISLRHTKALVRDEIQLPAQKRFAISMPFTAVEEQHYQSLFREMAKACGLSTEGAPLDDDWDPEDHEEDMRIWLNHLRQTVLHPEVAPYNRRALGRNKARPMRTVDEVLDAMLEQTENLIRTEERALLSAQLTRGQLFENGPQVREALAIWETVRVEADRLVLEARTELKSLMSDRVGTEAKKRLNDTEPDDSEDIDDELDGPEGGARLGDSRRRLRSALELQHKAVFFCANAFYQIRSDLDLTEPDSEEFKRLKKLEEDIYEEAKLIRREILKGTHHKATQLMKRIERRASDQSFTVIPELVIGPERGIESARIVDSLEALYGNLNEQANVIDDWREHVIQLLLKPLLDEDDDVETTGEELGESAKIQDELMVYVQALRAAISDRQDAITGQKNELIKHETQTSLRLAESGDGPAPEKAQELLTIRAQMSPYSPVVSMRGSLSEFRSLVFRFARDDSTGSERLALESKIASKHLKETQALLNEQAKASQALDSEVELFKTTMNARLEFYRQLQAVSDSVLPYEGSRTDADADADRLLQLEQDLQRKVSSAESKRRYLLNLKEAGEKSNEPRMCVICQTSFTTGVLTICGHQFCKQCMMMWFKAHHNCPVCKRELKSSNLHDITIKPQQLQVHDESSRTGDQDTGKGPRQLASPTAKKTMLYSEFNEEKLAEIKNIELDGPSFTTKVDTLVRHLIWLRESDPGVKSIVFSQYKGFLNILRNAFQRFRIGYASIDDRDGIARFKNDASIECFLLHARAHSSGLNLVNASHVFLCEPLLNTALELQAIARVDRIGQQHETTVWLYLVSGTVEESIYNLSVQRRMEHIGRNNKQKSKESTPELLDATIEAANTLELEQAALSKLMSKDQSAGEVVDKNDLWQCLFGHVVNGDMSATKDGRSQEKAVMGYMAAEAAEERMAQQEAQ